MCAAAVFKMWNISISIISPMYHKPLQLFHNNDKPPVVIIANGGDPARQVPCTHFSASKTKSNYDVLPGSALKFEDCVPRKLHGKKKGEKAAKKWCIKLAKRTAATKYNELTKEINYVKTEMLKVSVWYHHLEKLHVKLGEQLDKLGVEIEGIQITEGFHKTQTGTQTEQPETDQPQEVETVPEQPVQEQTASEQQVQQYDEHSEVTKVAKGLLDLTGLGSPSTSKDVETSKDYLS